jgi:type IV pilus assembly protein PilX
MKTRPHALHAAAMAVHQRGVSMIFALVTLVAMALAAVGLIRSVDAGTTILGNLSFKQDALRASDQATNAAITWLTTQHVNSATDVLNGTTATTGYYATWDGGVIDVLGDGANANATKRIAWTGSTCGAFTGANCLTPFAEKALDDDLPTGAKSGVKARYVIIRLCSGADPSAATTQCARPTDGSSSEGGGNGELNQAMPQYFGSIVRSQYFRIIVRTEGGRKSAAYTETLVHF